jgi:hypothetical protein
MKFGSVKLLTSISRVGYACLTAIIFFYIDDAFHLGAFIPIHLILPVLALGYLLIIVQVIRILRLE